MKYTRILTHVLHLFLAAAFLQPIAGFADSTAPAADAQAAQGKNFDYFDKQFAKAKNDKERSDALAGKAVAQADAGLGTQALETLAQAEALAPASLKVKLKRAIVLDTLGRHEEAYREFAALRVAVGTEENQLAALREAAYKEEEARLAVLREAAGSGEARLAALRGSMMLGTSAKTQSPLADIAFGVQKCAAQNLVFTGRYEEALAAYNDIKDAIMRFQEATRRKKANKWDKSMEWAAYNVAAIRLGGGAGSAYNDLWILWLTACVNQNNRAQAEKALTALARENDGSSYTAELIGRFYSGEISTKAVLEGLKKGWPKISSEGIMDPKHFLVMEQRQDMAAGGKPQAAFFCAGYLRFVAGDVAGAIKLLKDAHSDKSGAINQFIREALADKSWQNLANSKPYSPAAGPVLLRDDYAPRGSFVAQVDVPHGLALAEVREAVVAALKAKKWRITSDADSKATAEYGKDKGGMPASGMAVITLAYDERAIAIYNGGLWSPSWSENLRKELVAQLSRKKALQ